MGLTLEFLLGNDKLIRKASKNLDFDLFDQPGCIIKKADFSLHLAPKDLNSLSISASKFNNLNPITLREYLVLIVNERDYGLFQVANNWINYFLKVPADNLEHLAKEWFNQMMKEHPNEKIELTAEGIEALKDLYILCEFAVNEKKSVFHFWCL
ncbi:hypothetical protein Desaci_0360 [Desulfosporosinus acidiphilus SJ4]|uniref:Uncharacterized protein n=1 Tax=Desulfosporosinus acidiphilus (strain DSM 22704 / JCM 16185 / SJ4) TaxID=646529 RepID=I4D0V4_DESAJ|nr:hypothetical protein [Desulfosporosinus acidiphilus]AFM39428.1 hypothetical protein Desaci_0360 [Desulfosporosinus acidiphilus SJ4]